MSDDYDRQGWQDQNTVEYLVEAGHLKRTKRTGWWIAGIRDPESVAEHSFRTAIIAFVLADLEGADPERAAAIALFHDMAETRTGDIPSVGKPFVTVEKDVAVAALQTDGMPGRLRARIAALVTEFERKDTPEGLCAKDADKLECLLQAREYEAQGNQLVQPWIDTMHDAVRTEAGKRLADMAVKLPVNSWWHHIVASYGKPA